MKGFPKIFGFVTVGERGQIVIPSEARKSLKIKSGDKLVIVSGHPGHPGALGIIPESSFTKFINVFEKHISSVKDKLKKGKK